MPLKDRFRPALIDYEPYEDPFDPDYPSFAPYSMLATCSTHGLERITSSRVVGLADPTQVYFFACGEADPASFGP